MFVAQTNWRHGIDFRVFVIVAEDEAEARGKLVAAIGKVAEELEIEPLSSEEVVQISEDLCVTCRGRGTSPCCGR